MTELFERALKKYNQNDYLTAKKLFIKVLKLDPNFIPALNNLGLVYKKLQNKKEAISCFSKILKINSNYINSYYNLGIIYQEIKDFNKSKINYKKLIEINPKFTKAFFNLGIIYQENNEFKEAIYNYEKAIASNPSFMQAHINLATIFNDLGKLEKAKLIYLKVIKINPNLIIAYNNLANVLTKLGNFVDAKYYYKQAIKRNPKYFEAYINLGILCQELGEFEESLKYYKQAIVHDPYDLKTYYQVSNLDKKILNKNLQNKIKKILSKTQVNLSNLAYGNLLLSKFKFKEKNYLSEIQYLIKGHNYYYNLNKKKFDTENYYWFVKLPQNLDKLKIQIPPIKNKKILPIFVLGVPRSGTTLVEKIIASSGKNIKAGEETGIIHSIASKIINNEYRVNIDYADIRDEIINKYYKKNLITDDKTIIFTDKSLENFFYLDIIKNVFPEAKIINCIRNRIQSIMSIIKNNLVGISWTHNLNNILKFFDIYYNILEKHKKIYPGFIYDLKLETLVENPKIESKKLMNFCNLPWNIKCLEFYKRKDISSKTLSNIQIRKPIFKDHQNKYAHYEVLLKKLNFLL